MKTDHHLFYSTHVEAQRLFLDHEEAHHARSVLRLRTGDTLRVTDGAGMLFDCRASVVEDSFVECGIVSRQATSRPVPRVSVYIGLPDKEALELAVELLVPLGVAEIIPLNGEYCRNPWWKGSREKSAARLQRKAVTALKQAKLTWLPPISPPVEFDAAVDAVQDTIVVADEQGRPVHEVLSETIAGIACFVGPPGGFSPREMDRLIHRGAVAVRLSANRLRTELAACVLAATIMQQGL